MARSPFDRGLKAGLAALTLAGVALPWAPASAQGFFGLFDDHMSVADAVQSVNRQGFVVRSTIVQRGEVYVCDATGPSGRLERLIIDAHTGRIIQRFVFRSNPYRPTAPRYAYAPSSGGGYLTPPPTPDDAPGWQAPLPQTDVPFVRQQQGYQTAPGGSNGPAIIQHDFLGADDARASANTNPPPKPKPVRPKFPANESASLPNPAAPPVSASPTPTATPPVEAAKPSAPAAPAVEATQPATPAAPPVVAAKPPQPVAPPSPVEAAKPAAPMKTAAPVEAQKPAQTHKSEGVVASSSSAAPAPSPVQPPAPAPAAAPQKKSVNDIPVAPLD